MSDPISRFDLRPRLDAKGIPDNPWIAMMELDARMVIGAAAQRMPNSIVWGGKPKLTS